MVIKVIQTRDFSEDPKWPALIEAANSIRNVLYEAQRLLSLDIEPGQWDDRLSKIAPALRNIAGRLEIATEEVSLFDGAKPAGAPLIELAQHILNRGDFGSERYGRALAKGVVEFFQGGSHGS